MADDDDPGPCPKYLQGSAPADIKNPDESVSIGDRIADTVASTVGSWPFILTQSGLLLAWMAANVYFAFHPGLLKSWDPYPFILLNLVLSFQAAYTGPFVLMSQNRQADKDRLTAANDFEVDRKAQIEIEVIMQHLVHQDKMIHRILRRLEERSHTD